MCNNIMTMSIAANDPIPPVAAGDVVFPVVSKDTYTIGANGTVTSVPAEKTKVW
jgi:hypothetical protein